MLSQPPTFIESGVRGLAEHERDRTVRAALLPAQRRTRRSEIARLFADPETMQLHSRNVAYGCFMFAVTRVPK